MEGRAMATRRRGSVCPPGRVTVLYYLCRNGRHLEHPHLMELTLASPNHTLYLRDVMHRLDALRGKGMADMYSWSCKRRYKTGFVWHDVTKDDVLCPAQGTSEYVLKGSLLPLCHSPSPAVIVSDHDQQNVDTTTVQKDPCVKPTLEEESQAISRGLQQSGWTANSSPASPPPPLQQQKQSQPQPALLSPSSSSSTTGTGDEETARASSSGSSSSPDKPTNTGPIGGSASSDTPLPSLTPHSKQQEPVHSSVIPVQEAAPQTDGASTERELHRTKDSSTKSSMPSMATALTSNDVGQRCSSSKSGGKCGTLESLIWAEALGRRGGRSATTKRNLLEQDDSSSLVDEKEAVQSLSAKLNPTNLLMRLVACGCGSTLSSRNHPTLGLVQTTQKPRYSSQYVERLPSSPVLLPLGALIKRAENTGVRVVSEPGDW